MPILTRKERLKLSDQDPFETPPTGDDDPFATTTTSPAQEIAQTPESTDPSDPSIPVVDREGQPVDQTPPVEEAPVAPSAGPVDPAVTPADAPPEQQPAEDAAPAPEEAPQPPVEAPAEGEAAPAPQPPQETPEEVDGEAAVGPFPRGGKSEMRHYKIAYQTGPTSWEFHALDQVPEGIEVATVDGEKWVKARNNDHALRLGYVILGAPAEGVTVWPVPKGAYKPKRVKPAPPKPERTRLVIG